MPEATTGNVRPVGLGGIRKILGSLSSGPSAPEAPIEAPVPQGDRMARPLGLGGIHSILRELNRQGDRLPPPPPTPEGPPPTPWPAPSPEAESPLPPPSRTPWRPQPIEGQGATDDGPPATNAATRPTEPAPPAPVTARPPQAPTSPAKAPSGDEYRPQKSSGQGRFAGLSDVGRSLAPGAEGPTVVAVQEALIAMAFVIPAGATGSYGPQTAQAIQNFQAFAGLPRTGKLDAATWKALQRLAPPPGKNAWDPGADPGPIPQPDLGQGKKARVVVGIGQHRAFLFDKAGNLVKIYAVRTGREGTDTKPGVKVVDGKNDNPKEISNLLWPDAGGRAFGDRLLGLSNYNVATGKKVAGPYSGQELHGTDQKASIGRDFSHGCVGLANEDILEIYNAVTVGSLVRFDP